MACIIELLGYAAALYLFSKLALTVYRFIYIFFLGDLLGHTPNYKKLGEWAVVTGATDGIGKAYALEFGRRGLNVLLISRTQSKLDQVAKDIESKHGVKTKTILMDFTQGLSAYGPIKQGLQGLDIAVLINNVGMSYCHPEFFTDIPEKFSEDILNCNALSVTVMTRFILPRMLEKGKGVIINLSSFSKEVPTPLVAQYSATKAYVTQLSSGLATEARSRGVIVQSTTPAYVCSNMSKFTSPSLFVPSADQFVRAQLRTVGLETETFGCPAHKIEGMAVGFAKRNLPESVVENYVFRLMSERRRVYKRPAQKQE